MTQPLTPTERRVYHYLIDFLAENTYQPSVREIGKRFRIKSTKTVSDLLGSLANKGYIERDPSRSRGVRLIGYAGTGGTLAIPYYGKIHAGEPALLPEHREGFLTMDRRFVPSEQAYFLKVKGDSMIGRGINDGDYVMVNPTADPDEGAVIAARLGEEATIKTLRHRSGTTVLEPANPAERDIVVQKEDDFAVLGVVSGVFRPFFDAKAFEGATPA
ncbi:MAG TPA: transcriptional repressor LexA [Gemmatimonadaceae bacterium]|nr:transcriptional repressor LexA [Gemmatimonadaceae bacterium]